MKSELTQNRKLSSSTALKLVDGFVGLVKSDVASDAGFELKKNDTMLKEMDAPSR